MAKKRIPTGLIEAAGRVSQAQNVFLDRSKILDPAIKSGLERKREKEANNKKIQQAANTLMKDFDSNVDYTELSEQDTKTVKTAVMSFQKTYSEASKIAAAIEDKTSEEYQEQVDIMNGAINSMKKLRSNLDGLTEFKEEYIVNQNEDNYSAAGANSPALMQGYIMANNAIGGIDEKGNLNWDPSKQQFGDSLSFATGGAVPAFNFSDYKMPFGKEKGQNAAIALGVITAEVKKKKTALDDSDIGLINIQVEKILSDPQAYASLVSDADLPMFDFSTIDPEDPEGFNKAKELIVNAIIGKQGTDVSEKEDSDSTGKYTGQGAYMIGQYNQKRYVIPYPGTPNRAYFLVDKNGNEIERTGPGGAPTKEEKATAVGYQMFTRKNASEDWMTDVAFKTLPLNNPKELYLQNNNIISFN